MAPKLRPSEAGVLLCHQPTPNFYQLSDFTGRLCEDGLLSIVGLLPNAVLLIFVDRLQSVRPPSPADYGLSDLCRPPTTVFLTSVTRRLRSS
ncbi:hypothetical protein MA16_Dca013640 [Dendrobium catenatum]|uniref:Uncharacterized protein n=1 Tax=Dendrobium catenatum TaxID=906689 RepID=A0A2I0WB12_9ASPA|nr:hypothetical protein MA16_Dca013640 [Dendrobium catenatum]